MLLKNPFTSTSANHSPTTDSYHNTPYHRVLVHPKHRASYVSGPANAYICLMVPNDANPKAPYDAHPKVAGRCSFLIHIRYTDRYRSSDIGDNLYVYSDI